MTFARLLAVLLLLLSVPAVAQEIFPADRRTTWNPGLNPVGGIPSRTTIFRTINASTYGNGTTDATAAIQAALDACPAGQVVQLSAGDFRLTSELQLTKGVVLRGQGPTQTKLKMYPVGANSCLIDVGTKWFKHTQSVNLSTNAVKGTNTVTLVSNPGLTVGEVVLIDQLIDTNISKYNPDRSPPGDPSRGWFTRTDRPVGQIMEIASISGNTLTFTTPFHIDFQTAFKAQFTRFSQFEGGPVVPVVKYAGIEDLYVYGGGQGQGNIRLSNAAYSWVKNVESDYQEGEAIAIDACFRCTIRDSYVHSTASPAPGGGGYGFSFSWSASDNLLENNISWNMNKVMVMRASGGGNVIGYNYFEDGWIDYATGWVECGANASHMTTPHYELFEGNQAFNFDGDNTWGNAVYITVFRNHFTSKRRSVTPLKLTDDGNRRAIGLGEGHWWYTFVGNVLGYSGMTPAPQSAFVYDGAWPWDENPVPMWKLGYNSDHWEQKADAKVLSTVERHGNFDYFTNTIKWDANITDHNLPASLYLTAKPAFFGTRTWPWVQPEGTTKLYSLPARERFDGTSPPPPNAPPTIATAASASPNPVTATTTSLSVLGADDGGEANLTYTWATTGTPPAAMSFSANGTNAAKNSTATFSKSGTYSLQVKVKDSGGLSVTSTVNVTVNQTLTSISVSPANTDVVIGGTQQFSAAAKDQFGAAMAATFTWTVSGGGTINASGLFTAGSNAGGPYTVTAKSGTKSGTSSVRVVAQANRPPSITSPASAAPNPALVGQSVAFSVAASDPDGDPLTYLWSFGDDTSASGASVTHAYGAAGSYTASVSVTDGKSAPVNSSVTIVVSAQGGGSGGGGNGGGGGGGGSHGHGKPLSVSKLRASINFAKPNADTMKLSLTLQDLASNTALGGIVVDLVVGGLLSEFTLDKHGRGRNALGTCTLKFNRKLQVWTVTLTQGHGNWLSAWSGAGIDPGLKASTLTMPVALTIGSEAFEGEKAVNYGKKTGKLGTLKP